MELVALPADRRPDAASAPSTRADATETRPRRAKPRATQRLEKAQVAAFMALRAVSSYTDSGLELPEFLGRLCETIAGLVKAKRVAFWSLGPDRTLFVQPQPFGFAAGSPLHGLRLRMPVDGESVVERIVFRDELDITDGTSPSLDAIWRSNGLAEIRNSIAVRVAGRRPPDRRSRRIRLTARIQHR